MVQHKFLAKFSKKPIECYWQGNNHKKDCLIITSHLDKVTKYGQINRDGEKLNLHRYIFRLQYNFLPEVVMHTCDNPSCININHLKAGNFKENSLDMASKKRNCFGIKHPLSKLTEREVEEIKGLLRKGNYTQVEIAHKYHVTKNLINNIKKEKTWKHIL